MVVCSRPEGSESEKDIMDLAATTIKDAVGKVKASYFHLPTASSYLSEANSLMPSNICWS